MPLTEVYMALKTGVIDGFTSGWSTLYETKLHEVFDYSVLVGMSPALQEDIVVSPRAWKPLPSDLKQIVRNVFGEWAEKTKESALSGKVGRKDRDLLEKAGVRCTEFSEEDMDKLRKLTLKLQADWVKSKGGRVAEAWEIVKPIVTE
jgi:TRAP-type C4-dicarboxylate transport system substrate-binding protein